MRIVVKVFKWLGCAVAGAGAVGLLYQLIGNAFDGKYAPPASEMIMVDGRTVHFVCTGQGTRLYLLDAGAGVGAIEWDYLIPLLAKRGRVCSFDRPGLGWSDDTGEAHDVTTLVNRIGAIVHAAKIAIPFVYVGHSLGADDAIVYRDKNPHDVAALVLIEPGRPQDFLAHFHGSRFAAMAVTDCGFTCVAAEAAAWLGMTRFFTRSAAPGRPAADARMENEYLAQIAHPAQTMAIMATVASLPKSAYEIMDVKSFRDTPVLVLTSSKPRKRDSDETIPAFEKWRNDQLSWLTSLARMSSRGTGPIVIPDSNHASMVMTRKGAAAVARNIMNFLDRSM